MGPNSTEANGLFDCILVMLFPTLVTGRLQDNVVHLQLGVLLSSASGLVGGVFGLVLF